MKGIKGFQKGHCVFKGAEKGWFKKGIIPKTAFRKGHATWNKGKKTPLEIVEKMKLKKIGKRVSINTEFKKGMYREKSAHWKGGITSLYDSIRSLEEYKNWRIKVFIRDNYTCQECFQPGSRLHSHHHKKTFAKILQEFLQYYSQFSPIEDKETLVRLAITYEPFWNIDNGQTLCEECHKETDTYLKGRIK